MLARHIRLAGVCLIETALSSKTAALPPPISAPTLSGLKAQKTRELNAGPSANAAVQSASAAVPKIVAAS
jgi:hypothetical protein